MTCFFEAYIYQNHFTKSKLDRLLTFVAARWDSNKTTHLNLEAIKEASY